MLLGTIDLQYHDTKIHLQLFDPITAVFAVSGAGKSFIVDAIKDCIASNPKCKYRTLTPDNFELWRAIIAEEHKLWFIDNVDLLITIYPESLDYINSGTIPLVVFGRDFSGLKIDYRAYQRLSFDQSRKILTNDPDFLKEE